jgi:MGT family glycosyltransferase
MARILIGTAPIIGHVNPFVPLARALVARGHEVRWTTSATFREPIEATGVRFVPSEHARDFKEFRREDFVVGGEKLQGVAALKVDIKHGFIDNAPRQLRDLQTITRDFQPNLILGDPGFIGGLFYAELTGMPFAALNVLPLGLSSRDTAPNGLGLPPDASPLGRLRNRALNWAVEHVIFRDVQQHWNQVRAGLALPPTGWLMDVAKSVSLYMQPSAPGFEYPRSDLPANVHFIGMLPAQAPQGWTPPAWWGDMDSSTPIVHITQGTVANASPELIVPSLEGLADEDVLVVVSTGGRPVEALGLGKLPANARIASFISYPDLLPRTAAMVTNGGYGGVQMALSHGVPLVVAGTTEDKPEVAARVAWSGAGINLKTAAPTPAQVRDAVRALLDGQRYRTGAQALQAEYARYDAIALGVELLERLAATGRPVLRNEAANAPHVALTPAASR